MGRNAAAIPAAFFFVFVPLSDSTNSFASRALPRSQLSKKLSTEAVVRLPTINYIYLVAVKRQIHGVALTFCAGRDVAVSVYTG